MGKLLAVLPAVCLALVCCSPRPKMIPAKDLTDIYADMFVQDQWVSSNSGNVYRMVDTTLAYDAIFRRHGYTFNDYDYTVRKNLEHPEKFAKIVKAASAKISQERKKLEKIEAIISKRPIFSPYVRRSFDSIGLVRIDSSFYRLPVEADTLSIGPVPDSLEIRQSVDTLKIPQSVDTLKIPQSVDTLKESVCAEEKEIVRERVRRADFGFKQIDN